MEFTLIKIQNYNAQEMITAGLQLNAKKYGNEIAVMSDGRVLSFSKLNVLAAKLESILLSISIDQSSVVGLRIEDPVRYFVTSIVLLKMGITQASINTNDPIGVQEKMILKTDISFIIQDMSDTPFTSPSFAVLGYDFTLDLVQQGSIFIRHSFQESFLSKERPALIFVGSGTTGKPKIMAVTFSTLAYLVNRDISVRHFEEGERHYSVSKLIYYTALRRALGCFIKRVTLLLPKKKIKREVEFCRKFKVDHLSLTVSQAIVILEQEKEYTSEPFPRLPELRSLFAGSSPINESLRQEIRGKLSKQLHVVYGSNEFGEATIAYPEDLKEQIETVGKACPGVTVEIVNKSDHLCKYGETGRVRLKSEYMMNGYLNASENSNEVFTQEGYYPRDMGYMTKSGHFIFSGREDDMMIYQGVNIYPREIESILEKHSDIIEAAAFPLKIKDHEGVPFAAVHTSKQVPEKVLLQLCQYKLGWRSPKRIFFFKKFPRNTAGKILKQEIVKIVMEKINPIQKQSIIKKHLIPKIIHQTHQSRTLHPTIAKNIKNIKQLNPEWEYRFYDNSDQIDFISKYYSKEILDAYNKINPLYGAARADLFRYLLIYKVGGVWLDIKNSMHQSLDDTLQKNDTFLLSQWQNRMGEAFQNWGLSPELRQIPGGEFQQWHIISAANNPLIKAVIQKVLKNIYAYSTEKFGVGMFGVSRTTGSIAYTLAIAPLLSKYPHRFVDIDKDLKFEYTILEKFAHRKLYKTHYSQLKEPLILG